VAYSPSSTGVTAADALLREGNALHQRGEYGGAANNFERGIRMAPRSPALYLALAKTRLATGDNTNAIQMANRALSLLPSGSWAADDARAEAWNVIANAREAQGDRTGAAAARQKAKGW
jgi:tetratricopeptide (TPR) repeat protein